MPPLSDGRACHRLRVCRCSCAAAVDVGRDEVDFLAVLVRDGVPVRAPSVSPQDNPVLRRTRARRESACRGAAAVRIPRPRALNTTPAMVVPVFVAVGAFRPTASSTALRRTRSAQNGARER